ncbi:MAG: prolipoprotein diacylglyceryl transferase [Oscillospiraceae bacterium]|nr:prolipoprotein diacylglyceryl transferase [Oscillospiraceae bacterium]
MTLSPISFPSLGLVLNPPQVAFELFGRPIYWYGIIIAVGFLLAVAYGMHRAGDFELKKDDITDMLLLAVPLALICARAYYCLFYWDLYRDNPISCLYIWEGGIAIYGGIIGAIIGVVIVAKLKKMSPLNFMDVGALGLLIGQCIGRWGNFVNREAHGGVSDTLLRMGLVNEQGVLAYYHPTFFYESAWNLIGFVLLHVYSKRKGRAFKGEIFLMYVAWYGLGRTFIEGMRTDSLYLFGTGLRVSQVLAAVSCIAAIAVWAWFRFFRKAPQSEAADAGEDAVQPEQVAPAAETMQEENEHDAD